MQSTTCVESITSGSHSAFCVDCCFGCAGRRSICSKMLLKGPVPSFVALTVACTICSQIDEMYENGANIQDDQAKKSNSRGRLTFATSGTNTRSTQVFVNLADNHFLDNQVLVSCLSFHLFWYNLSLYRHDQKEEHLFYSCQHPLENLALLFPSLCTPALSLCL